MRALSRRNDDPPRASRPFDSRRDGLVMGEAAGVLVLEELEHAQARGAKIYAELIGYGMSADASHITEPDPTGASPARAMTMAIDDAGIDPAEVGYVNAHATSTPLGDAAETRVIKIALGEEHARRTPISSTKGATGHTFGAAGAIEADVQRPRAARRVVPPTINYENADPDCDLDYIPNEAREAPGLEVARLELVRLRRPQRDARLRRWDVAADAHAALGDLRLLRDADRLERRDPRRARARLRRRPGRREARARYHELEPELEHDGKLTYREVMTEAMRRLGAPAGEEAGSRTRCPAGSRFPRCAARSRRCAAAAGGSRSCRTPTPT